MLPRRAGLLSPTWDVADRWQSGRVSSPSSTVRGGGRAALALERRPSGLSQSGYRAGIRPGIDLIRCAAFAGEPPCHQPCPSTCASVWSGPLSRAPRAAKPPKRFGVSPASAIRWHEGFVQQGRLAPKPQGGDQRSHRIEAHAALILQTCEAYPWIFLRELRDALQEQGVEVSTSRLSRFFARHAITRKKGQRTRLSRSGRT